MPKSLLLETGMGVLDLEVRCASRKRTLEEGVAHVAGALLTPVCDDPC